MPTTQDERSLKLTTPLAKDYLMIKRVRCREGLNQLFRIELEILHEEDSDGFEATVVDAKKLLGNPMLVAVKQAGPVERFFHGICINFTQGSRNGRFSKYRAELVPKLWMLTQISQSRIFQNKTVPQILEKVLQGYEFKNEIQGSFKPRNYCVQYRESDWDFASRMMEEEGIYYYFEHTADNHRLIMANTPPSHRPCPSKPKVTFALDRSELKDKWTPSVHSWRVDNKIRTGKYELWDYNFQLPTNNLLAAQTSLFDVGGNKKLEHYDWPGGYAKRFDGIDAGGGENPSALSPVFEDRERTVQIRQEELDVAYKNIYGTADCCSLAAGYRFQLKNHPAKENNINHVLVNVQHEAIQSPSYISDDSVSNAYMVNFVCIPHGSGHAPFRPLRKTLKPVVHGSQTAKVVGRPGDEIFTDKYGRVKVQFCWDREGKNDNKSSCWIRVGTLWAGKQWGVIHIPRVGQEVIVDFLEGDPDSPIIVGSVYNPDTMPPYTLPDNKTQSGVKSRSSKGGSPDNFNEFRFEDLKGNEEVYLHAEKDWTIMVEHDKNQVVGHDETHLVGNDRSKTIVHDETTVVKHDRTETVQNNETITIIKNRTEKVGDNETITVGKDRKHDVVGNQNKTVGKDDSMKVNQKMSAEVGDAYTLTATNKIEESSKKIVVTAGVELILQGPGGQIKIDSGGVTITGVLVKIN